MMTPQERILELRRQLHEHNHNYYVLSDYSTYSGKVLEEYFKQQFIESGEYGEIGSYWEAKKGKEQCEIDIVGLSLDKKQAVVVEVKRQRKEFKSDLFDVKVQHVKDKILSKYELIKLCLTIEDM